MMKNNLYGYYKVNDDIYTHKISALIAATKSNTTPTWHFHKEVYSKFDWQQSSISIKDAYQKRAKQLREKYDYLVMSFSGGSDSWSAIQSFIDSGTHLDEIFVRWPISATVGKYTPNTMIDHASNILSEWELTIYPMLTYYQKIIPKTKITVHDFSDQLLSSEVTDNDWMLTQDYLNVGSFIKFQAISDGELKAIESGKSTAIIFGTDKPQLCYRDGGIYCYFIDKLANCHAYSSTTRVSELFYWTPDVPEITISQAHELYNFVKTSPALLDLITWGQPYDNEKKNLWNKISKSIIYPDYAKLSTFQVNKSYTSVLDEVDDWMKDLKDFRYKQSWKWGLDNVLASIDKRFIELKNGEITGLSGFIDDMYYVGSIDKAIA